MGDRFGSMAIGGAGGGSTYDDTAIKAELIKSGAVNQNVLELTKADGTKISIDVTSLSADIKATSGAYNTATKSIDITLSDNTKLSIPVSELLPVTTDNSIAGNGADTPLSIELSQDANNILVKGTDGKLLVTVPQGTKADILTGTDTVQKTFTPKDINESITELIAANPTKNDSTIVSIDLEKDDAGKLLTKITWKDKEGVETITTSTTPIEVSSSAPSLPAVNSLVELKALTPTNGEIRALATSDDIGVAISKLDYYYFTTNSPDGIMADNDTGSWFKIETGGSSKLDELTDIQPTATKTAGKTYDMVWDDTAKKYAMTERPNPQALHIFQGTGAGYPGRYVPSTQERTFRFITSILNDGFTVNSNNDVLTSTFDGRVMITLTATIAGVNGTGNGLLELKVGGQAVAVVNPVASADALPATVTWAGDISVGTQIVAILKSQAGEVRGWTPQLSITEVGKDFTASTHTHTNSAILNAIGEGTQPELVEGTDTVNNVWSAKTLSEGITKLATASPVIATIAKVVKHDVANTGCINGNPYFLLKELDYESALENPKVSLVTDRVQDSSMSLRVEGKLTYIGTVKFPVVTGREYRAVLTASFSRKDANGDIVLAPHTNEKVNVYVGVVCFDSDDRQQYPYNYPLYMSEIGILTQDLSIGDTTITYSANSPVFARANAGGYSRQVYGYKKQPNGDLCYVGQNGRVYDPHGYTKYGKYVGLGRFASKNSEVDNGDGTYTLTLTTPWDTVDLKVGDAVIRTQSGGFFSYWLSNVNMQLDNKFHKIESQWTPLHQTEYGTGVVGGSAGLIRNGTAYCKQMVQFNYAKYDENNVRVSNTDDIIGWYSNIRLEYRSIR